MTLSAIPVHASITCSLSAWAIQQIDKRRRAFLWCRTESVVQGKCKIAWPIVCSPKCYGGLGLLDIRVLGFALRLCWEWQKRAVEVPPWTKLPSKSEKLVCAMFNSSVVVKLDGTSARFWFDSWLLAGPIAFFTPHLFRAIGHRFLLVSVQEVLSRRRWVRHITGVHTAHLAMDARWHLLRVLGVPLVLPWYVFFVGSQGALEASAPPKVKLFFWLALHGRIWTADRRKRHGLQDLADCALYGQEDKTVDHLLVSCVYARELWRHLLR